MKSTLVQKKEYQSARWEVHKYDLVPASIGTQRKLVVHHFIGDRDGPTCYFQAGLHGGEHPGILVLHQLIQYLKGACSEGTLKGEIIVVPCANPIGLSQQINGELLGRFDFNDSGNFNRNFPDISDEVKSKLCENSINKQKYTIPEVKCVAREILKTSSAISEVDQLKNILFMHAVSADMVFDLHCDGKSILHIYGPDTCTEKTRQLSAAIDCNLLISGIDSVSHSFEDSYNLFWRALKDKLSNNEQEKTGFAVTVELRGRGDVSYELARKDAKGFLLFLQANNLIEGSEALALHSMPDYEFTISGLHLMKATSSGLLTFCIDQGAYVKKGDNIANIIDPVCCDDREAVQIVKAPVDGILFSLHHTNMVKPGQVIFKIASAEPSLEQANGYLES